MGFKNSLSIDFLHSLLQMRSILWQETRLLSVVWSGSLSRQKSQALVLDLRLDPLTFSDWSPAIGALGFQMPLSLTWTDTLQAKARMITSQLFSVWHPGWNLQPKTGVWLAGFLVLFSALTLNLASETGSWRQDCACLVPPGEVSGSCGRGVTYFLGCSSLQ